MIKETHKDTSQDKIRWGVIGAGGFADARAIPALKKCKNASLQAVLVTDLKRANQLAEKHNAPEAYEDIDALLSSDQIDAVYICTPVALHNQQTIAAARAGKHVFVEKPMADSVEECWEMIRVCHANGVKLGVAYMMRFRPQCQEARRLIEAGRLGSLVTGRAQNYFWYPSKVGAWRQDSARSKGGVLLDVGSHIVDTLRFLMGEVQAVQGLTGSEHFDYPVEDTASALLYFENGAIGIVDCSWAVPYRECPLEIYGTGGSLIVSRALGPFTNPEMRLLDSHGEHKISLSDQDAYTLEFEAISQAILEDRRPPVDGHEGLRITEILLAIYRSAEQSTPLSLNQSQPD